MGESTKHASRWAQELRVKRQPVIKPTRACDKPGCEAGGSHKAPRSRTTLHEYYWFCLDHVREYNQSWDFFRGMTPGEIDAYQRATLVGLRPTWKLGGGAAGPNEKLQFYFRGAYVDPFLIFDDGPTGAEAKTSAANRNGTAERRLSKMQQSSLDTLGLEANATLQDIKARFKELVKRYHPDANGGDRGAEERLGQVIKAYGQLRSTGYS
ncbi:MAG: J domain-containing protein [Alphaproteobacteria bacterium]|nr:J domain-containing protein [Alphaproteobacteria bacterium]